MSNAKTKLKPRVVVFTGPNGAAKSTHADAIMAKLGIETYVIADFIACGLSRRNTDAVAFEAGRIMLKRFISWQVQKQTLPLNQHFQVAHLPCFCAR